MGIVVGRIVTENKIKSVLAFHYGQYVRSAQVRTRFHYHIGTTEQRINRMCVCMGVSIFNAW